MLGTTQPSIETTQRTMAMRRPPAGFNLHRKDEPRNTFPSLNIARSVPASRCNSEDFAELWNQVDELHIDEEKKKTDLLGKAFKESPFFNSRSPNSRTSLNDQEYKLSPQFDASFLDDVESPIDVSLASPFHKKDSFNPYDQRDSYSRNTTPFSVPKMASSQLPPKVNFHDPLQDSMYSDIRPETFSGQTIGSRVSRSRSGTLVASPLNNSFTPSSQITGQAPTNGKLNRRRNISAGSNQPKAPCRYFALGQCTKGIQCQFPHILPSQPETELGRFSPPSAPIPTSSLEYKSSPQPTSPPRNARATPKVSRRSGEAEKSAASLSEAKFGSADFSSFVGRLYSLCADQAGCRYLQETLEKGEPNNVAAIFNELSPHFAELMTDPFGNYLSQKLVECASGAQRVLLLHNAFSRLSSIAHDSHGTRATQKIIDYITTAAKKPKSAQEESNANQAMQILSQAFGPHVVSLIKDTNGNHVIQKCINLFPSQHNQFVFDAISKECLAVATHKHGCCVIQRCFEQADPHQREQLAIVVASNASSLVQDPFGNYVLQYVIALENCIHTRGLIQNFIGHVPRLSAQKFGSNVIEVAIKHADKDLRRQLIEELLWSREFEHLVQDSYANYVLQTCILFAEPALREQLVNRMKPILLNCRSTQSTKRLLNKILEGEASNWMNPPRSTVVVTNVPPLAYIPQVGLTKRLISANDLPHLSCYDHRV